VGAGKIYLPSLFGAPKKRLVAQQRDTFSSMALRKVEVVKTEFTYDHEPGMQIDWHDLTDALMDNEDRNDLIIKSAVKEWKRGESVLIASRRVDHAKILHDMLLEKGIRDANILTGETNADRIYTEKLVEAVLNRNSRMLSATSAAIMRGANLNPLSCLILAMPVNSKNLEQLIGRIRRRAKGKKSVKLIYVLDDKVIYLKRVFFKSMSVFRKMHVPGYENKYYA
jgi:superfamily II DNA or RNA helicase